MWESGLVTGFGGLEVLDFDVDAEQNLARFTRLVERESPGLIERLTLVSNAERRKALVLSL